MVVADGASAPTRIGRPKRWQDYFLRADHGELAARVHMEKFTTYLAREG